MSRKHAMKIGGKYPERADRMAFPGKFLGRVHLDACRTGYMICPGLGPEHGRPYYDDRWGVDTDWIDGESAWNLFKASAAGDLEVIAAILDEDPRLVNAMHWYTQPIHLAARHGHAEATELLLARNADPGLVIFDSTWSSLLEDTRSRGLEDVAEIIECAMGARFGYDPAFMEIAGLIENSDAELVETALNDNPELVDRSDAAGNNGLHLGVINGRKNLVELFLERGLPIDSRRADGKTPLTLSFDTGFGQHPPDPKLGITEHLLMHGANYAITAASYLGDHARVRSILDENPSAAGRDASLKSPLGYAARAGHEDIARMLLDVGVDGHVVDEALFEAVWCKHAGVADILLEYGANPNVELDSCGYAAGTDDQAIRDLLVRNGGVTPPYWDLGHNELRQLVDSRAARVQDPYLISNVLETEDVNLIDRLLGGDPRALDRLEELQYLPGWGDHAAITRKLVAAGLDPNRRTFEGQTYLHICARQGWEKTAQTLIELGASVNVLDEKEGWAPLAVAVKNSRIGMVRLLLEHGADPDQADWPWTRPLTMAEEIDNKGITELLRQYKGKTA